MKKHEIIARLRRDLQAVTVERRRAASDVVVAGARVALRRFQSTRMAKTHADLLADTHSRAAAQFFLDDLYGSHDLTRRDADIERLIPTMERLMPSAALQTIAEAIELDALSEQLDRVMAERLGATFSESDYIDAYRQVASRAERESQIAHIQSLGESLCELVRVPLIGGTLSMMRAPAKLAGLSELHQFLERGFSAFKQMKKPKLFVVTIVERESDIMRNLYACSATPFDIVS
jgi:hypothetical protein